MIRRSFSPIAPRMRIPVSAVLAIAIVACAAVPATLAMVSAQTADTETGERGQLDEKAIETQRLAILDEIATLDAHPWAGEYYEGDGLGANIAFTLAPDGGVAATWRGCLGLYGANRGKVVEENGTLRMRYERANAQGFGGFPDALRSVAWGARRYLIPEARMMAFVNAIHHGHEPRERKHGMFLLAEGDEKRTAEGMPDLPLPYRDLLRSEALELRVVSSVLVDKKKESNSSLGCNYRYRLTLDRGANDGLVPGLELRTSLPKNLWERAKIETVGNSAATAMLTVLFHDCDRPKTVPDIAWRFTTGAYRVTSSAAR